MRQLWGRLLRNAVFHPFAKKRGGPVSTRSNKNKCEIHRFIPAKISLLYLIAGALWILISDRLLVMFVSNRYTLANLQIAKGWVYVTGTAILLYFVIKRYIIALHESEKEINEKDYMYKLIIEGTTDGQWDYNVITGQVYVSPQWMKYMGYHENITISNMEEWKRVIHPDDLSKVMQRMNDHINGKKKRYLAEFRARTGEGDYCWFLAKGLAIRDKNGDVLRLVGTHIDITPRKNVENSLRKAIKENERLLDEAIKYDKLKTEFFSNISHEFRTPINVILGTLQLMDIEKGRNEEQLCICGTHDRYVGSLRQNCFRLLHMINNLMDITSIDSGMMDVKLYNSDIVGAVKRITGAAADYVKDTSIAIKLFADVEWKLMACDLDKLDKIILNLISNAVKHSKPDGSIWVSLSDRGEKILLAVADTGSGIPQDKLDVIFDRFRQGDSLLTRDSEGVGIGLALVKSIVELLNGKIWVQSELGKGSTFFVELPAAILPSQEEWVGAGKIMLADPQEKVREAFSDIYLERYADMK